MWVFKTTAFEPQSQRSKQKKDLSLSAREKRPKTVQICTTDHYDQILEGFSRFLGPENSNLKFEFVLQIPILYYI